MPVSGHGVIEAIYGRVSAKKAAVDRVIELSINRKHWRSTKCQSF